ncbi:MAG: NAD(P)/FAD-dependent oxidoreductase [Treponema sp.]|nr:NAD(P)/FAD-dependent oxidoreductase [Treponema sp.]
MPEKSENQPKKVIVVGAGIAGLTAAIYAQRSGFDVTIMEKHIIPGGLSTSWSRKGYLFEGGMHWLTGSSEKMPMHQVWKETGALQDNNPIFLRDPFYTLVDGEKRLYFYRNIDKLRSHFLTFAPEDKSAINQLYRDVKKYIHVHKMVSDIAGLKAKNPVHSSLPEMLAMLPAGLRFAPLSNMAGQDYIARFKNKDLRHLLSTIIGTRYNALSLIYTLASFASGDCGYPEGGSLRMAQNMADTFLKAGGKIEYRHEVNKVEIKEGKACGVWCKTSKNTDEKDEFFAADAVIVTEDARKAIDTLFESAGKNDGKCSKSTSRNKDTFHDKWAEKMRKNVITEQNMFVCLGVKADLKDYPRGIVYPLSDDKPFEAGGLKFKELRINNYALYEKHAPEGCTALTCLLLGDSYNYWKKAKEDGTYKEKKAEVAAALIQRLEEFIPEIKDNIEVIDVATPLTYERYTNSFEGSWMSVLGAKMKFANYPIKAKSVKKLYFAGQRQSMPGGLPIAGATGRTAAQYLCRDFGQVFVRK